MPSIITSRKYKKYFKEKYIIKAWRKAAEKIMAELKN